MKGIDKDRAARLAREVEETALTLIEDRGWENARSWAEHCKARDTSGFWLRVLQAISSKDDRQTAREMRGDRT